MTIAIIAHSEHPPVRHLQTIIQHQLGFTCSMARTPLGEMPPAVEEVRGLIIMGSLCSVNEYTRLRWLQQEMQWVEQVLQRNIPTLGICFGAQMLAHIAGGSVRTGEHGHEFGYVKVQSTAMDTCFGQGLDGAEVFQCHHDAYTPPLTATRLLQGHMYAEQATRFAPKVYGVQFHSEITEDVVARWHQFGLDHGHVHGPHVPATAVEHAQLARQKQPPIHAWLEGFLERLFAA
ncbi:MAG: type 1 glutamine amidotransferase [Alphaproteobacteria bacterium]